MTRGAAANKTSDGNEEEDPGRGASCHPLPNAYPVH